MARSENKSTQLKVDHYQDGTLVVNTEKDDTFVALVPCQRTPHSTKITLVITVVHNNQIISQNELEWQPDQDSEDSNDDLS